tara:strand:+ start:53 stop:811 length:759 start_codon:yes stop_codon:yes gene_type:complete
MFKKFISLNQQACAWFTGQFPGLIWPEHTRHWFASAVSKIIDSCDDEKRRPSVLEVGGIDRPFLEKGAGFDYVGMDIEHRPKCDEVYDRFFVQSIEEPLSGKYDLIISRMVLEHVPDNEKTWSVMYEALKPGGKAIHIFPSGLHPYSLATRLVGNKLQRKLIRLYRPNAVEVTGYPAFYNRCSPRALRKTLERMAYGSIEIRTNYSAAEYFNFFLPAFLIVASFNLLCHKLGVQMSCSNVFVSVQKPEVANN